MPMRTDASMFLVLALSLASASASAQEARVDRFYSDKAAEGGDMVFQGRLTSSTFFAQELGQSITNDAGAELADNASPATRLYTELRTQLGLTQPGVARWDVRADARVRVNVPCEFVYPTDPARVQAFVDQLDQYQDCRTQSGTFGGNEYDVRELYATRTRGDLSLQAGRQYVTEIGATKLDGVKAAYELGDNWSLIGFGGLAPSRISRSVADDYLGTIPIALGAGGAYRYDGYFGSVGAAGIVPLVSNAADGSISAPRTFITSNGYWRPNAMLDIYHFASIDLTGESTAELSDRFTNVSLGVNVKPVEDLRLTLALHQFSTNTLDEFARERLDQVAENDIIQNNVDVLRLSAQAARLGASLALAERRFEISTSFQVRRRPSETVCPSNDVDCMASAGQASSEGWSGEAMLSLVDRRSIGGLRLGASVINMFGLYELGLGDDAYGRSNNLVARLDASRGFMNEQLTLDADVSYLHAEDVGNTKGCAPEQPLGCYGSAVVDTVATGATVYYRFLPDWFAMATVNAAWQMFEAPVVTDANRATRAAYANTLVSGFLRAAYRF